MRQSLRLLAAAVFSSISTAMVLVGCGPQPSGTNSNAAATQGAAQEKNYKIVESGALVDNEGNPVLDEHGAPIVLLDKNGRAIRDGESPIIVKGGSLMIIDTGKGFTDADNPGTCFRKLKHCDPDRQIEGGEVVYKDVNGQTQGLSLPRVKNGVITFVLDYHRP